MYLQKEKTRFEAYSDVINQVGKNPHFPTDYYLYRPKPSGAFPVSFCGFIF